MRDFSVLNVQRNYASGVYAADTGEICFRHWKEMLIEPETTDEGPAGKEKALHFHSFFPPCEQCLSLRAKNC